ncbi:MAG: sigma-54 dependent transcriptional regulator [Acidobacteriaceae bacterium]|nr:sigma-54 dependent transcriptional regulator [Acidobacteriaceae bacterium]
MQAMQSSSADGAVNGSSCLAAGETGRGWIGEKLKGRVLVVDDDDTTRTACLDMAKDMGFATVEAENLSLARQVLKQQRIDLLLLDLRLAGGGGLDLLEQVKSSYRDTVVVVMTAFATVPSAVKAMRMGAADYLTKPFARAELEAVLARASERISAGAKGRMLREKLRSQQGAYGLIGRSPEMLKLHRMLSKVACSAHPVLILGESGTGKELVARAVHHHGPNASKPFVPVDCGALVPSLIESELFGHVKGAFTGADRAKDGPFVMADGGTVFLDEVGEIPLELQAKLLRALQEKEIRPVGATQSRPFSARVLAATNRDLAAMVKQGRFRKDLFFRLNVVGLKIPPLRERRGDIHLLATYFVERSRQQNGIEYMLSDETLRLLDTYDWPGNVRELENAMERACMLSSGPVLQTIDMPTQLQQFRMCQEAESEEMTAASAMTASQSHLNMPGNGPVVTIAEMEKQAILGTIRQLNGDKLKAAKLLGIGKTTLYRKLKQYDIA